MSGRFFGRSAMHGSADAGFESGFFCPSFFAALLLFVDTVIAVSIFVSGNLPAALGVCTVFALLCVVFLHVLLENPATRRSKPLAVSI